MTVPEAVPDPVTDVFTRLNEVTERSIRLDEDRRTNNALLAERSLAIREDRDKIKDELRALTVGNSALTTFEQIGWKVALGTRAGLHDQDIAQNARNNANILAGMDQILGVDQVPLLLVDGKSPWSPFSFHISDGTGLDVSTDQHGNLHREIGTITDRVYQSPVFGLQLGPIPTETLLNAIMRPEALDADMIEASLDDSYRAQQLIIGHETITEYIEQGIYQLSTALRTPRGTNGLTITTSHSLHAMINTAQAAGITFEHSEKIQSYVALLRSEVIKHMAAGAVESWDTDFKALDDPGTGDGLFTRHPDRVRSNILVIAQELAVDTSEVDKAAADYSRRRADAFNAKLNTQTQTE